MAGVQPEGLVVVKLDEDPSVRLLTSGKDSSSTGQVADYHRAGNFNSARLQPREKNAAIVFVKNPLVQ